MDYEYMLLPFPSGVPPVVVIGQVLVPLSDSALLSGKIKIGTTRNISRPIRTFGTSSRCCRETLCQPFVHPGTCKGNGCHFSHDLQNDWTLLKCNFMLPTLLQEARIMIVPSYEIRPAAHAHGKGVFLLEPVSRGQVIVAPDAINRIYNAEERAALVPGSPEDEACVRWFESYHTVSTDWPDDCYVNHSFSPTGLWHLGFVFATRDLAVGDEVTVDYSFLVDDDEKMPFMDAETGREIIGYKWADNLRKSTEQLLDLLEDPGTSA